MKFTINTKEFKNVMSLVKTVADSSASAQVTAHNICLLRAFPEEKNLILEFSLGGSFLTYTFENVQISGDDTTGGEVRRSLDLSTLSALKFSGESVSIVLGRNKEGNTLEFSSGKLKGKLLLSHPDIERIVEDTRPSEEIELTQQFQITDFLNALSAHLYGSHHNAVAASRRIVRIYNALEGEEHKVYFASKDPNIGSYFSKTMHTPFKDEFNYYVHAKPFRAIVNSLSQDISNVFHFGINPLKAWRMSHGQMSLWFPNIVQEIKPPEFSELVAKANSVSSFTLVSDAKNIKQVLSELAPFTSGGLSAKSDTPIVRLVANNDTVQFALDTTKAKDVVMDIEDVQFDANGLDLAESQLMLNSKYLEECVDALALNGNKKIAEPLKLLWWPHNNADYPVRGKMLCLNQGSNYFWLSRVVESARTV